MNRLEFMNQLEQLLSDIPDAEKKEALQYYEDYFDDAGVESEQEVLNSLESPEKIAQTIKSGIEIGQKAFESDKIDCCENEKWQTTETTPKKEKLSTGMIVLIIILCVFASPFLLSALGTVLSALASVIITFFAVILALGAIAISFFVSAILLLVVGIIKLFAAPAGGLVLIGAGLLLGGFALLALLLTVWLIVVATPALFKGIVWLCKAPFKKKAQ